MTVAEDTELELLLNLDGTSYEAAAGYVVEFSAKRVPATEQRPHGIAYSLVLRPKAGGEPLVRFDNAHAVPHRGGRYVRRPTARDHWHRTHDDPGRPYPFASPGRLLEDFWREVRRALEEKGVTHGL